MFLHPIIIFRSIKIRLTFHSKVDKFIYMINFYPIQEATV